MNFRFVKFLLWASSDRNQTSSTTIVSYGTYISCLTNWLRARNSVKTVKLRSWKLHLQKLKMGQNNVSSNVELTSVVVVSSSMY